MPERATDQVTETSFGGWFAGRRMLVIGASSGIGRAITLAAAHAGARVGLVARRVDLLTAAVKEAGGPERANAFAADVTVEAERHGALAAAATWMGGLDTLVIAAGRAPLTRLDAMSQADWRELLLTNLVGPALLVREALPTLRDAASPVVVLLSTHIVGNPWPWLGAYSVSKAALEELANGLRAEEPWLRVVAARIGDTATGFADAWDQTLFSAAFGSWADDGRLAYDVMQAPDVAERLLSAVADVDGPDDLLIRGAESTK